MIKVHQIARSAHDVPSAMLYSISGYGFRNILKRQSAFVFISFLFILVCSFMVSSISPDVLISDRIPQPNEKLGNLKEGANATIEANNCSQTRDILPDFIKCKRGTVLYSAWFDDRHAQNYIQVLLMTSRRNQPPTLSCRFQNGPTSTISVRAVTPYYEINKRYSNKRYGLFVASCILSKDLVRIPNFVNISIANECTVVLPVGNTRKKTSYRRDYRICFPPIFGNIRVASINHHTAIYLYTSPYTPIHNHRPLHLTIVYKCMVMNRGVRCCKEVYGDV